MKLLQYDVDHHRNLQLEDMIAPPPAPAQYDHLNLYEKPFNGAYLQKIIDRRPNQMTKGERRQQAKMLRR